MHSCTPVRFHNTQHAAFTLKIFTQKHALRIYSIGEGKPRSNISPSHKSSLEAVSQQGSLEGRVVLHLPAAGRARAPRAGGFTLAAAPGVGAAPRTLEAPEPPAPTTGPPRFCRKPKT